MKNKDYTDVDRATSAMLGITCYEAKQLRLRFGLMSGHVGAALSNARGKIKKVDTISGKTHAAIAMKQILLTMLQIPKPSPPAETSTLLKLGEAVVIAGHTFTLKLATTDDFDGKPKPQPKGIDAERLAKCQLYVTWVDDDGRIGGAIFNPAALEGGANVISKD